MKVNDNIPADAREDVIELGVASIETKGMGLGVEPAGPGTPIPAGIAEE